MRTVALLFSCVFAASAAACVGTFGETDQGVGPSGGASGGAPVGPNAADASPASADALPLPRLSRDEYIATVSDVVREALPSAAPDVLSVVLPLAQAMPADALVAPPNQKHGGFSRLDQSEQQQYADVPFTIAVQVGRELTKSADRLGAVLGACAAGGAPDAACLASFVRSFGAMALRRPLTDDDVAFYAGSAPAGAVTADGVAQVIAVLLSSPRFLYHVESGADAVGGSLYQLDAWELASRLSYHFWGTMPDAQLRADAQSGALLTPDGYARAVDRLFADPRTDATLRTFFTQWLWPILELPALDSRDADPLFKAFAGANLPGPQLRDRMVNDVLDAASWVTAHGGSIEDLLTNTQSFARDADLAAIYGVSPWDGTGTPPALPPERAGLLTRAAFLSTGTSNTRPIMKGVFIRTAILCDDIPPPPPNAAAANVSLQPGMTTREVIEQVTEQPGSVCAGCHHTIINPLGYATEDFDALGRHRTAQTLFDAQGNVIGNKPVDTSSIPLIGSDTGPSTGIADVTRMIAQSGKLETCFASRYFRFAFRRMEDPAKDAAPLADLAARAKSGTIGDVLKSVAMRPEFKQRWIAP